MVGGKRLLAGLLAVYGATSEGERERNSTVGQGRTRQSLQGQCSAVQLWFVLVKSCTPALSLVSLFLFR